MSRVTRLDVLLSVLLFYQLNTVICQQKVEAYVGEDVLLPCVYDEASSPLETVSVFWRDKDDNAVLNIKPKQPDFSSEKFRGRVVSAAQDGSGNGNFSIVMKDVQQADSGPYDCHIPSVKFQRSISLTVSERRVEAAAPTPPPGVGPSGGVAAVTPTTLHARLLLLLLSLTWSCFKDD